MPAVQTITLGDTDFEVFTSLAQAQLVFEDDGESKYLYVMGPNNSIQEAIALRTRLAAGPVKSADLTVEWSADGKVARATIAGDPVAIVDFGRNQYYSKSQFPPPNRWSSIDRTGAEAAFYQT